MPAIYHFQGLGDYLEDKLIATKLKDAAIKFSKRSGAIIITGDDNIPDILRPISVKIELLAPRIEEYSELFNNIIRDLNVRMNVKVEISPQDKNRLLNNMKGLTLMEAEKILTKVIVEDDRLSPI